MTAQYNEKLDKKLVSELILKEIDPSEKGKKAKEIWQVIVNRINEEIKEDKCVNVRQTRERAVTLLAEYKKKKNIS